jgi:hypothetical protein
MKTRKGCGKAKFGFTMFTSGLKAGEESFNGRSAAFKPQQAPNFAQAAKPQSVE